MRQLAALVLVTGSLLLHGCGTSSKPEADGQDGKRGEKDGFSRAADVQTCVAAAHRYTGVTPPNFARGFPLPQGAVLFDVEDRGEQGAIGTAVVKATLEDVLAVLNGTAQDQGYAITDGETEEHDAEANWQGNGYRGRWAIRDSASCRGEVVIQVLSKKQ